MSYGYYMKKYDVRWKAFLTKIFFYFRHFCGMADIFI